MKMKMNIYDAQKIFGLTGDITPEDVKRAYRKASMKFHPDVNPAGEEMMKAVNAAYEALENFSGVASSNGNYGDLLNAALNAVISLNVNVEVCGSWIWVSGDTKSVKETLKEAGFKYAFKKKMWFFRPEGFKSKNRKDHSMGWIRDTYGSDGVRQKEELNKVG